MSKMKCKCGHGIIDQTDSLPYKAYFLPDEDVDDALDPVKAHFAEFIEARERGEWDQYTQEKHIPTGLLHEATVESILHQLFCHPTFEFGREMYECESCGRIWMQARPDKNEWVSYLPESPKRGILKHGGTVPDA